MSPTSAIAPDQFTSFGALLKFLRQRAGLTQRELSIAVGYNESHISRLEHGQRAPDAAVVAARFVPALGLEVEAAWVSRLLALAGASRAQPETEAPPPTAASPTLNNLPAELTTFVGRERELTELHNLLADPAIRLITLTGPGGIGKSRLALQAAGEHVGSFRNGIWYVPLAPVPAGELVVFAVANALGLHSSGQVTPHSQLLQYLRDRAALLVLDNFEHLLSAGELVTEILQQSPQVKTLVTSRERLGLRGEWVLEVAGLDFPEADTETPRLPSAVRLFVTSGQQASAGFSLDGANRAAAYRICRLVEGMPLALELAAAWLPVLTVDEIADELRRGLDILTPAARATAHRQSSLRAVFDRSWGLMTEREREVFRRLSVFRGGFTREAAQDVASANLPDLASLSAKALIRRAANRYELHELLRQYGHEQLIAAGEADSLSDQHLTYFVDVALSAEGALVGAGEVAAVEQLMEELDNIRAALSHAQAHAVAAGLELAGALRRFWPLRNLQEGLGWLLRLLEQPAAATAPAARAKALLALADLYWMGPSRMTDAQTCAETALALCRSLGDKRGAAQALLILALASTDNRVYREQLAESLALFRQLDDKLGQAEVLSPLGSSVDTSDPDRSRSYLETSLALCRQLGWVSGIALRLTSLGTLAMRQCDFVKAQDYLAEVMALDRQAISAYDASDTFTLAFRGELALRQGRYDEAEADFEALIAHDSKFGLSFTASWSQAHLGRVAVAMSQPARAYALFTTSLSAFHASGLNTGVSYACEGLAYLSAVQRQPERAVRLISWADRIREAEDDPRPLVEQLEVDGLLSLARSQVTEAAFAAAYAAGQAMTLEEAVEYALAQEIS